MSYEGYVIYYCANGHEVSIEDYHWNGCEDGTRRCWICGSSEMVEDHVDQTNGCYCEGIPEDKRPCHAHPRDLKIVAWDSVPCDNCEGEKHIDVPASYKYWPCACKGENPACGACYGTGHHPLPDKTVKVVCPTCAGSGKIWKERFDLTPLKRHY